MAFEKRLELEGKMGGETGGEPTFASKAYMCITGHAYGHVFSMFVEVLSGYELWRLGAKPAWQQ